MAVCGGILLVIAAAVSLAATDQIADLQARFDRENDAVRRAKLLEKLGDAQFEKTRAAAGANDYSTVGLVFEKYRDNVRVALDALKKRRPDAERHSDGYRQLEVNLRKGIREVDDALLQAPDPYKPPLKLVRQDLGVMDDEVLQLLFPRRVKDQPKVPATEEKKP